jgi:phosphotransferase system enzyme I (PtsI)
MHIYTGQVACEGVVIGNSLNVSTEHHQSFSEDDNSAETLSHAINISKIQLQKLIESNKKIEGEILEFQISLLEDSEFLKPVFKRLELSESGSLAWSFVLDELIAEYSSEEDSYFRARSEDLKDLKQRVLHNLNGFGFSELIQGKDNQEDCKEQIVIARELSPSQFIETNWENCSGIVLINNSPNSHVAILAKSRGIPMLTGADLDLRQVNSNVTVILDCVNGDFIFEPDRKTVVRYNAIIEKYRDKKDFEKTLLDKPAITEDGVTIQVQLNMDDLLNNPDIPPEYCDGVGLTRTEFMFTRGYLPDEEEQFQYYAKLIHWAKGKPVTFRTMDAGGDKPIPQLTPENESNPFLGLRGVRLSLANEQVFRTQLRALARACCLGEVRIMIPMVTENREIQAVRKLLNDEVAKLLYKGVGAKIPQLGMMVEVPIAALQIEDFDVDFYSIGSNDLIQYLTSVSRDNHSVVNLYHAEYPALWKLIAAVASHGNAVGREVSVCGNIAGDTKYTSKLLAAGIRCLSVTATSIAPVKAAVRRARSILN